MQSWGSEEDEEEASSSSNEMSSSRESGDDSAGDGGVGRVSDGSVADSASGSSSSSSIKRGLLRRVRDSKSSPSSSSSSSSVDTTGSSTRVTSGTSSTSNINSRSSVPKAGAGGGGGSIFQAVIFVDNGAYANVVYETATSALQSYQRLQPTNDDGEIKGIVTYLSDTGSLDERAAALNAFREGKAHILVCSDIAARGLDVPNVSHVFQVIYLHLFIVIIRFYSTHSTYTILANLPYPL